MPRRKKKTLGKAYSKEECDCENCRASYDEDRPGLESTTPLAAIADQEVADGTAPSSRGVDAPASAEQSDWQGIGNVTEVYGAPSSESSGSEESNGMRGENDG